MTSTLFTTRRLAGFVVVLNLLAITTTGRASQQAPADVDYFLRICGRTFGKREVEKLREVLLKAYRWQYIVSGVQVERCQHGGHGFVAQFQHGGQD